MTTKKKASKKKPQKKFATKKAARLSATYLDHVLKSGLRYATTTVAKAILMTNKPQVVAAAEAFEIADRVATRIFDARPVSADAKRFTDQFRAEMRAYQDVYESFGSFLLVAAPVGEDVAAIDRFVDNAWTQYSGLFFKRPLWTRVVVKPGKSRASREAAWKHADRVHELGDLAANIFGLVWAASSEDDEPLDAKSVYALAQSMTAAMEKDRPPTYDQDDLTPEQAAADTTFARAVSGFPYVLTEAKSLFCGAASIGSVEAWKADLTLLWRQHFQLEQIHGQRRLAVEKERLARRAGKKLKRGVKKKWKTRVPEASETKVVKRATVKAARVAKKAKKSTTGEVSS